MRVYVCGIELNAIRFFSCCGSLCAFFCAATFVLCKFLFYFDSSGFFSLFSACASSVCSFGAGAVVLEYNSHTSNSAYSFRHLNLMGSNAICCLLLGFC